MATDHVELGFMDLELLGVSFELLEPSTGGCGVIQQRALYWQYPKAVFEVFPSERKLMLKVSLGEATAQRAMVQQDIVVCTATF